MRLTYTALILCAVVLAPNGARAAPPSASATSGPAASQAGLARPVSQGKTEVPLRRLGGAFIAPVTINNAIQLPFVIDSGASDVSIPANIVSALMQAGIISSADFLGKRTYRLADGSVVRSPMFRIRSLKVSDQVLENVLGSEAPASAILLLGQSFLSRFRSWSIDNRRMVLVLE
jgi:predicted aspartyl protease